MFAVLHSDINFHKPGLLHLTGQPYCRSAKVKDAIINLILRNYLVDRYKLGHCKLVPLSLPPKSYILRMKLITLSDCTQRVKFFAFQGQSCKFFTAEIY